MFMETSATSDYLRGGTGLERNIAEAQSLKLTKPFCTENNHFSENGSKTSCVLLEDQRKLVPLEQPLVE